MPARAPEPHARLGPGPSAVRISAYEIHHNQHRPHRSLGAAAPLKPLPEPVDLERYRVRRQTHTGCLINEYRLVA
jgi:putative transposase